MNAYEIHCEHACRNVCAMLNKAITLEANLAGFYEQLNVECDYPEIENLLVELMDQHRKIVSAIGDKLADMQVRGQALDGIMASFDPAGC